MQQGWLDLQVLISLCDAVLRMGACLRRRSTASRKMIKSCRSIQPCCISGLLCRICSWL